MPARRSPMSPCAAFVVALQRNGAGAGRAEGDRQLRWLPQVRGSHVTPD